MMLYRVLAFALLCGAPIAVSGATVPAVDGQADPLSFAASAEPRSHLVGSSTTASPLDPQDPGLMWDPLGEGCIDAADPAAWLPRGERDREAGAFCLPQPCARLLTEDEMVRDVLGRPLREGEWDTYLARYAETCSTEVMWEPEATSLPQAALPRPEAALLGTPRGPQGGSAGGMASTQRRFHAAGSGWGFGGAIGGVRQGGTNDGIVALARAGGPQTDPFTAPGSTGKFESGGQSGKGEAPSPANPPAGSDTGEDGSRQPVPVPLPGSFLLLTVAVAALRLPRR